MKLHKEGRVSLLITAVFIVALNYLVIRLTHNVYIVYPLVALSALLYLFVMYFFRIPNRQEVNDENAIIAPCDGRVVVIEDTFEEEHLKCKCKQVSIFMSPLDVHMNWFPVSGRVTHVSYQKGNHFVAWAPKASTDNERATVILEMPGNRKVMVRQIAGAMARRVVCYAREKMFVLQNDNLGFIKFGSRVDLFLPDDIDVKVSVNQRVTGTQTVIARFKK
jgi:phosphatidylserine decarboxylase